MKIDEKFIRFAIEQSEISVQNGNYPYGAVLVHKDEILFKGYNTSMVTRDISDHAELSVLRQAAQKYDSSFLAGCTLYSSCEPCAMCSGAIYWSGVGRVVYSCPTGLDSKISDMPFAIPCRDILNVEGGHSIEIIGPLLEDESVSILKDYWNKFLSQKDGNFGLSK